MQHVPFFRLPVDVSTIIWSPSSKVFPSQRSLCRQHILCSMGLFQCPQCGQWCKSISGLTRHQNSAHRDDPGLSLPVTELRRIYHASLNGMCNCLNITLSSFFKGQRCDRHGIFISQNAPQELPTTKADNDWTLFVSWANFELAEFLFTEAELSQKKINKLLELWAATLIPHGDSPPIVNRQHLHRQIDAIKLGNIQWENTVLKYDGPLQPTTRPPEWKTTGYDVWYRNPREVIKNMLARTDFDGHIDYAAYQEFSGEKRQYSNLMSGNWSWRQSVCLHFSIFLLTLQISLLRMLLLRTLRHMAPCSSQLSWGLTKRPSPLPPAKMIFTPYTFRLETFKTIFDACIRTHWF